ncbi:MAG TPA: hypothetical protein VNB06_06395 [Thermoanaerobaculia bacterium]|nr:hypothetical protein [Thermoanaerobaculia bacterium]
MRRSGNGSGPSGSILVSPLADAVEEGYRELWCERGVPELGWIAELLRGRPLLEGFRLALATASSGRRASGQSRFTLFAAAGSYSSLDADGLARLRLALAEREALAPLSGAMLDLVAAFPSHPMASLASTPESSPTTPGNARLGSLLDRHESLLDPASRSSLRVQLVVLWQAVQAGVLRGASTRAVADMAHAARFPLTPESLPAARGLLGLAAQVLQVEPLLPRTEWPDRFWARYAELRELHGPSPQPWRP